MHLLKTSDEQNRIDRIETCTLYRRPLNEMNEFICLCILYISGAFHSIYSALCHIGLLTADFDFAPFKYFSIESSRSFGQPKRNHLIKYLKFLPLVVVIYPRKLPSKYLCSLSVRCSHLNDRSNEFSWFIAVCCTFSIEYSDQKPNLIFAKNGFVCTSKKAENRFMIAPCSETIFVYAWTKRTQQRQ